MTAKDKFYRTVREFHMFSPGEKVLVAVSGGADSMCLLHLLWQERETFGIQIGVAHVNHGIRGNEAKRDETFVKDFCANRNIPFHLYVAQIPEEAARTGESIELCARRVRYRFFASLPYDKIATAHTGTDAVETLLMHLSRGSSLHGLASIPPVRGKIIRPLIHFTRTDTERYCFENSLQFVTDSTNLTDAYTRNRFRHRILEPLRELNPAFEDNALRCIEALRRDDSFMDAQTRQYLSVLTDLSDKSLSTERLVSLHQALRLRIIAAFISENSHASFEERHLLLLDDNLRSARFSLDLPTAERIFIQSGRMYFEKNDSITGCPSAVPIKRTEGEFFFGEQRIVLSQAAFDPTIKTDGNTVDLSKIDTGIVLRSRCAGDRITLANRGCTKTLKKLFSESKIPPTERKFVSVLADSRGVIWVEGFGADASRLPDRQTKKILIIKTESGNNVK